MHSIKILDPLTLYYILHLGPPIGYGVSRGDGNIYYIPIIDMKAYLTDNMKVSSDIYFSDSDAISNLSPPAEMKQNGHCHESSLKEYKMHYLICT